MFQLSYYLKPTAIFSISLVFGVGVFGIMGHASAQTGAITQSTASSIPEKKPDGTWESLSPRQQMILTPLESDWDFMKPEIRKKWIQIANLYPKMSDADQQRLQSRMNSWSKLSQKDRRLARENYLSSLKFPSEKKAEAWNAYQQLSDEQKKKLANAEVKRKKPSAMNAPTLQQHPIIQKSNLAPTLPSPAPAPIAPSEVVNSEASETSPSETSDRGPSDQ
ncbi:MAG: hypothetical protein B7X83_02685 [Polynucleobacter sp. 17-46-58]|jgi:hypothetical protein|nr:MAG: hypothetical protein B7Y22_01900 [Polynucleobacter sp. 16-46-70]OZA41274.1 MAG: hypothetical protein B7X83_02685 [Polynucleobacter sp. 17-46-58]